MKRPHPGPVVFALSLLTLAAACGTSDDPGTTDDGGGGGTTSPASFCEDVGTALKSCTATCSADVQAVCTSSLDPLYSAAYHLALHDCASQETACSLDAAEDTCLFGKVIATAPTTAQTKLAADFCAACVPGSTVQTGAPDGLNCSGKVIELPQGFGRVMGIGVLQLSDSAAAAAESCIAPAQAQFPDDYNNCENTFLNCITDQEAQAEGPSILADCAPAAADGGS